jgi:hypothetical protein
LTGPQHNHMGNEDNARTEPIESSDSPASAPAVGSRVSAPEQRGWLRGWRAINSAIFLVAFIAPWLTQCGGQIRGYETPFWLGLGTWSLFVRVSRLEMWAEVPLYILAPIILIGVLGIVVYTMANAIGVMIPSRAGKLRRFPNTLKAGLIGMLASIIYVVGTGSFMNLLWGYWLTWMGLVSSLILEATVRRRRGGGQAQDYPDMGVDVSNADQ